jgi:hypothetical protein
MFVTYYAVEAITIVLMCNRPFYVSGYAATADRTPKNVIASEALDANLFMPYVRGLEYQPW